MPQLESEPEHCFVCGAPATRRIKGDWYCSKHALYKTVPRPSPFPSPQISEKVWQIRNERLRELPMDCRIAIIEEIVKADVRRCIESSGIHDPICQSLAEESGDMEEYLLSERDIKTMPTKSKPSIAFVEKKLLKCDKNPCDLKIKGKRKELVR